MLPFSEIAETFLLCACASFRQIRKEHEPSKGFFHLPCVSNSSKLLFADLYNGWAFLSLCIDLCYQVMQTALLLLLVAPLAGIPAPVEKPSSPYRPINAEANPGESSPTCYRRWRHHSHLTFRLARVQSCSRQTDRRGPSTRTNVHPKYRHHKHAISWVG